MTDNIEDRDAKDRQTTARDSIGSAALAAALLYAPAREDRREDKRPVDTRVSPDTD